jgi:hypothetical protein
LYHRSRIFNNDNIRNRSNGQNVLFDVFSIVLQLAELRNPRTSAFYKSYDDMRYGLYHFVCTYYYQTILNKEHNTIYWCDQTAIESYNDLNEINDIIKIRTRPILFLIRRTYKQRYKHAKHISYTHFMYIKYKLFTV